MLTTFKVYNKSNIFQEFFLEKHRSHQTKIVLTGLQWSSLVVLLGKTSCRPETSLAKTSKSANVSLSGIFIFFSVVFCRL